MISLTCSSFLKIAMQILVSSRYFFMLFIFRGKRR